MVLLTKGGLIAAGSAGGGGAFVGPLDGVAANLLVACDYRRLLSSYTGPICRTVDAIDIGYNTDGSLNTSSLTGTRYIAKVYNQTGSGRDAVWSGATNGGPRIISGGVVETLNGHACAKHIVGDELGSVTLAAAYTGVNLAAVWAGRLGSQSNGDRLISLTTGSQNDWDNTNRAALIAILNGGTTPNFYTYRNAQLGVVNFTDQVTLGASVRFDGTNATLRAALGSDTGASTAAWNFTHISVGYISDPSAHLNANSYAGALIVWGGDPGSTGVESIRAEASGYYGGT